MFPTVSKAGLVGLNSDLNARTPARGGGLRVRGRGGRGEGLQEAQVAPDLALHGDARVCYVLLKSLKGIRLTTSKYSRGISLSKIIIERNGAFESTSIGIPSESLINV